MERKIRIEIDSLIGSVKNVDELLAALEERGYILKKGKHISVKAPGQQRAVRLENLGEAYTPESLGVRISYAEVGSSLAYPDEQSELRNAYEFVLGKVTRLAEQGEKAQRKRDRSVPYSPQIDLDIYRLSAQLTVINRDRLHSIGEVEGKIAAFKIEYEKARNELNKLTAQLEKLDSLAEQAEHYFSLMDKGENVSETDKLLITMEGETLQRNNICSYDDYLKMNELRKSVRSQATALKEQFNHAKHYYDVYNDIAKTYHDISEGDVLQ